MLEKWRNILDKGKHVGAVFMDLSKAFDTINHDLLITKLKAYGFSNNALLFMLSYLKNRSQRVGWCSTRVNPGTLTFQYLPK